ncbi:FG-GAP repeat domain-containing protein [Membranihabitans marinus]|uniref:FG-GAP repeat domain-containing protein n=1 Tax=Membranihabitans marinus TaxID=1227546 RepID=UPI001F2A3240|nr:VCBS repeat-containing protein [Membranihabitans marinus]
MLNVFSVKAQEWLDAGFESISKGSFSNSGQNLYVNSEGEIKSIRRYDVNDDGFIDLMFNSTHDQENYEDATLWSLDDHGNVDITGLPVEGSLSARSADLNKDGYPDIVFCPNKSGIQHPRRFLKIYWGTANGWSSNLCLGMLPVNDVSSVEIADLNGDSWPDLLTLNSNAWLPNQPSGKILRVYWGSAHSFQLNSYTDIGLEGASEIICEDFTGDGKVDILYANQNGGLDWISGQEVQKNIVQQPKILDQPNNQKIKSTNNIYSSLNSLKQGKEMKLYALSDSDEVVEVSYSVDQEWKTQNVVENMVGTDLSVDDLDGDGHVDFVLSNFEIKKAAGGEVVGGSSEMNNDITIIWGGKKGGRSDSPTIITLANAISSSVGDLNGDGKLDIAVAVYQGEKRYDASSKIYFGKGNRKFVDSGYDIPTRGANTVCIIEDSEWNTAVFSNSMGGNLYETVPLYLYLGTSTGFSENNLYKIPFTSGYESTAADVNEDGYVDILAINSMHGGGFNDKFGGINIFTGSKNGFDFSGDRQVLRELNAATSNVADLNKDGYLDIIVGLFDQKKGVATELVIHYGSAQGYTLKNRQSIISPGRSSSPMVADFDKDGWLDIVVSSYSKSTVRIFKGSENGFSESAQETFPMYSVIDLEVADLNADGYLDIIACHYKDHINGHHDLGMTIMWGSQNGFQNWNSQWLPSYTPLGPVVADFDGDGYLDLFAPAYHGDISRESLPMYLYWGSKDGFSVDNKTILVGDSGTDAMAADFDKDGRLDLAVAHHTIHGSHAKAKSKVYYNDGNRFQSDQMRTTELSTPGVHWMWNKDMGNIYDRSWTEFYTSQIFNWNTSKSFMDINWEAMLPSGARLELYFRSSSNEEQLKKSEWNPVSNHSIPISTKDRCFQYKVFFISPNGDAYPMLKSVQLALK